MALGEAINLVAQLEVQNQPVKGRPDNWFAMEQGFKAMLGREPPGIIDLEITIVYRGTNVRPDWLYVNHSVNGVEQPEREFKN